MKKIIVLLFLCLTMTSQNLANDIFKSCQQFIAPKQTFMFQEKLMKIHDSLYYYHNDVSISDTLIIYNIQDSSMSKAISLVVPPEYSKIKTSISEIFTKNDTLIFGIGNKIYKYLLLGKNAHFLESFNLDSIFKKNKKYYFSRIKFIDNVIYGVRDFYNTFEDTKETCFKWEINLNNLNENRFDYVDFPNGYYWTIYQPRHVIDNSKDFTLVADITNYKIKLYNRKNQLVDSIVRNVQNWEATSFQLDKFSSKPSHTVINRLQKDTTKNLIHRVNFINDSTILVCYSMKPLIEDENNYRMYYFYYDVWKKESNNWVLKKMDLSFDGNNKTNEDCFAEPLENFYVILNNQIITLPLSFQQKSKIQIRELK